MGFITATTTNNTSLVKTKARYDYITIEALYNICKYYVDRNDQSIIKTIVVDWSFMLSLFQYQLIFMQKSYNYLNTLVFINKFVT